MKTEIDPALSTSNQDLSGRYVIVRDTFADYLKLFLCRSGNGCNPEAIGRAVFGTWVSDGSHERIDRYDAVRFATQDEIDAGNLYARLPAAERLQHSLNLQRKQVDDVLNKLGGNPKAKRDELVDAIFVLSRHVSNLRHQLDYPLTDDENGPTGEKNYIAADAERWDKRNKQHN